ncbi:MULTISPECIES: STAS domain-containing protein [unclassified Blastococcus]
MHAHVPLSEGASPRGCDHVRPAAQLSAPSAPPAFRAYVDRYGIALVGDLDVACAERLAGILGAVPIEGDACTLDLSGLRFADVAGCRAIARWARSLADAGVRVELRDAPPLVQRAWQLLALDRWARVAFTDAA